MNYRQPYSGPRQYTMYPGQQQQQQQQQQQYSRFPRQYNSDQRKDNSNLAKKI